jgi:ADP-glucose pyrophosphorylase
MVAPTAHVSTGSLISRGVVIEAGAQIEGSVIGEGAKVGAGARLVHTFVAADTEIPASFIAENEFFGFSS